MTEQLKRKAIRSFIPVSQEIKKARKIIDKLEEAYSAEIANCRELIDTYAAQAQYCHSSLAGEDIPKPRSASELFEKGSEILGESINAKKAWADSLEAIDEAAKESRHWCNEFFDAVGVDD